MGLDLLFLLGNIISLESLPYLLCYLTLGLPGLYFSIRHSEDIIDSKNKSLVSFTYLFWPFFLGCVLAENAWSIAKKIARFGKNLVLLGISVFENALVSIANKAEITKRQKLEGDFRVEFLKLTEDYSSFKEDLEE